MIYNIAYYILLYTTTTTTTNNNNNHNRYIDGPVGVDVEDAARGAALGQGVAKDVLWAAARRSNACFIDNSNDNTNTNHIRCMYVII